ncbi:MAG TPA: ribonuclease Y [Thermoanaerobaculales bacterium]|nr:ribonuclease Y [Thermoanaerobaculales bacterium]HQL28665.1 ribonuclease Y [Thermoanaerobaculales bacterium]HQN96732.1 ribonuclease Y [Thermoanaerobaculales bacterium]
MKLLIAAIGALLVAIIALIVVWALWRASRLAARRLLANAEKEARRIRARAEIDGQRIQKDGEILVRERLLAARTEFEHETRDYRIELDGLARELDRRERELAASLEELTAREADLGRLAATLGGREAAVVEAERRAEAAAAEQRARLEQISGMTADQARSELMRGMEHEARMEAAGMIRRVEEEATEKAKDKARRVISMAIQRIASEHVVESTVAVVDLPSDEMKGRIIGREGRNIRAFEQATGVDLIVDDTPEAVILSCFEPVRREIARLALTNLIQDGRIHPGRIEELVAKVQTEMDEKLLADGEAAALEAGIPDLHPELQKLIGRLQFRSSFGQNALKHSLEVSWLAHHMAAELGVNAKVAGRAGLLHDIGKAVDREMEGTHLELGRELLRRHGESDEVIHAMECHHGDVEPHSVEAVLVTAADALSAARPGARREILENYIKRLDTLEKVANDFKGVDKAYAIQAGRELRIVVESDKISDEEALWLARDVAKKVEAELTYPGQIKVTVIRETRAVEYAR